MRWNEWDDVKIYFIGGSYNNFMVHSSGILKNIEQYYYMFSEHNNITTCTFYNMIYRLADVRQSNSVWDLTDGAFNQSYVFMKEELDTID